MSADIMAGLLLGALVGVPVGRAWAEIRRARHDMRKIWDGRKIGGSKNLRAHLADAPPAYYRQFGTLHRME